MPLKTAYSLAQRIRKAILGNKSPLLSGIIEIIVNTFIDLFAGIGGFRIALQRKGMKCVFSSEIDSHARKVYERNFNDIPSGDITEISEKDIPAHDILCAGFPCQAFSISGNSKGLSDPRGRLFYEIVRVARFHRPYVLILENVKNIITINNGNVIKTIEHKLNEIGYNVEYKHLNASFYGVPQKRERVYFICTRRDLEAPNKLSFDKVKETNKKIYLKDILEDEVDSNLIINRKDIFIDKSEKELALKPIRIGYVNKGGQGERIYSPNGHAITLSATGGGVGSKTGLYYINNKIRRLSLNECKEIMNFDKNHIVSAGHQGYKQLGNAVIPSMIEKVYDSIKIT